MKLPLGVFKVASCVYTSGTQFNMYSGSTVFVLPPFLSYQYDKYGEMIGISAQIGTPCEGAQRIALVSP